MLLRHPAQMMTLSHKRKSNAWSNTVTAMEPILVGYKYHRPTLWRVTIPPPQNDTITIPRAVAGDPFLKHSHDDTTTASLKCDEILDHLGPSSAPDPTTQRTTLYGYRDFSYASGNNATIGTYKVPLVHNLKKSVVDGSTWLKLISADG